MAAAPATEPFSIRGFAARMRAVDAGKCYPFGGGCRDGVGEGEPPPQLPPMDLPPRSRWWAHELAAERARLSAGAKRGEAERKGTKRKGSRSSAAAERTKKRRRALQFRSFLKNKEKTSKPPSTSRLHQHMLHIGLLGKRRSSTIHTRREPALRKKLEEARDYRPTHENSLNKQNRGGMDNSSDMRSSPLRKKGAHSFVNKRSIKISGSTSCPLNPGCEVVKHIAYPPKDDIFGDLPLLESSKIMFGTRVDELPTVIEESFVTNQSGPDSIPESVPLKLIHASDITAQMPSPLEHLVKNKGTPQKKSTCISQNDAARSHPSPAELDGPPNHKSISTVKTCHSDMQLKYTDRSTLSSCSDLRSKCGSSNLPLGCFDTNTNCPQEIKKHGTSSATSPSAVRTRTEAAKTHKNAVASDKKSTDISGPVVASKNYLSSEVSVLSSTISQGVVNTRPNADVMYSCTSMPAKECIPTSRPSGNFTSNVCHESRKIVGACTPLSTQNQGSWYSELHPVRSPANIGLAFMKLPGLERLEISSNLKTGENRFPSEQPMNTVSEQPMNTVRYPKQQLVSGMANIMQGQKNIGFSNSQDGKTILDCYVGKDVYNPQQPTMRLMGKTVSVYKHSKDHSVSTIGKICPDKIVIEENRPSSISCRFPQKRLFLSQDSVTPRGHLNDSSDFLARIPNSTLSEQNTTFNGLHNQRLQPIHSVSSTVKGCTWNFGGQFVRQDDLNKASMVNANSVISHTGPQHAPHMMSIPWNQQSHLCTPASRMSKEDHNFVGPAVNQSSSFPQDVLKASMKEKYQKSILSSYDDPSFVPIRQPYQIPRAKLSSAPIISFFDYGAENALSRNSSPGLCPSLTTSLSNKSISATGPTCTSSLTNTDGRKCAGFADQINSRTAYADNVKQQPAKRQLVTERQDFTFTDPNMINHSLGWSLSDAVGPQILDFSNRVAGAAVQVSRNENYNLRAISGSVPAVETWSRAGLVAGAKTMLRPGQNLNDQSKLYSTKISVDNDINSVVL
ncbi:uncharacterized protein LOC133908646 [Phragmites australis]|uniref:uncharacterized protein LOC133908646 n=1 Tax=Phragmites australis TaxID=29695 RepID=UPI002D7A130E|nr:uncharacterized protein LOC133908646 [Phragmites australis]